MATGYKDYRRTVAPEKEVFGLDQTLFRFMDMETLTAAQVKKVLTYDIPVGYDAILIGIVVTCVSPGINMFTFDQDGIIQYYFHFDTTIFVPFQGSLKFIRSVGDNLNITIQNNDSISVEFISIINGFLIPIE